jgi:hypothetical protein
MRFMFLIHTAHQGGPTPQLMSAMHAMAEREVAAGRMVADGGLTPASMARRVAVKQRKLVVMDGPFAEVKEVMGGFAIFELPDMAAAVESAREFMDLHREHMPEWEGTCEIRQVAGSEVQRIRGA